jgi:hypothetical protein
MELGIVLIVLIALDLAALRWGVDSTERGEQDRGIWRTWAARRQ